MTKTFAQEHKQQPPKLEGLKQALSSTKASSETQELKDAYAYAYLRGITTQETIQKADLHRGLTRAEMAKMMAVYATQVMGKQTQKTDTPKYADVNAQLGDLADYITLAYQLGIMGVDAQGNPLANFNPQGQVSRAEFATVLSRVMFGDKYNTPGANWAQGHLNALKTAGILKSTQSDAPEMRGRVMLMLQRAEGVK